MMMHKKATREFYAVDEDFEFFSLPLGNSAYSIWFVIPNKNLSASKAAELLTPQRLIQLEKGLTDCNLEVYLSRFTVEGSYDVTDMMKMLNPDVLNVAKLTMFDSEVLAMVLLSKLHLSVLMRQEPRRQLFLQAN
ncbi:MAG: hypothetical protein K1W02_12695 [Muribaculaceae bacterium]|jgi:Serpin (serine protease inhibitor).